MACSEPLYTLGSSLCNVYTVKITLFAATPLTADSSTSDGRLFLMLVRKDHMLSFLSNTLKLLRGS
jgi:hypothetical protein